MFSSAEELIKKYLFRFLKHYLHLTINFSTEYTKLFPKSFNHFESNSDSLLFWRWSVFSHLEVLWIWKIQLWNTSEKNEQVRKKVQKVQKGIKSISDPNQQHLNWKEYAFTFFPTFYTSLIGHHAVYKLTLKVNI